MMSMLATTQAHPAAAHARAARRDVPRLADEISAAVAQNVSRRGVSRPAVVTLVDRAASAALNLLLDDLDGERHRDHGTERFFWALGRAEGRAGLGLTDAHAALFIGTRLAWRELQNAAIDNDVQCAVSHGIARLTDHLCLQLEAGHHEATRARAFDLNHPRIAAAERLLSGGKISHEDDLWDVPKQVIVAMVTLGEARPEFIGLPPTTLIVGHRSSAVIIADATQRDTVCKKLLAEPVRRVVSSWPVDRDDVADALTWVRRAAGLIDAGVIPKARFVDCTAHRAQIWLHSEPVLRRQLAQELLRPLLAQKPNSRRILSETLLIWLQTRDSTPAIAATLGVHPQTVRYRWKKINELFGDQLHDPETLIQLTMLLNACVPLWKSGDQSDFALFRSDERASLPDFFSI